MPQVFTALMFAWMFNTRYGVVNDVLGRFGVPEQLWLIRPNLAVVALVVAVVWKTSSFVALILLGGLQGIPHELSEAARVDGATGPQVFWRVTLPLLRPAIAVALIFRTLSALQLFDVPYAMTNGGPGRATETLGIYVYRTTLEFLDFGYGAALSLALFAVSLVITSLYLRFIRPEDA
jgi:multiple sugar transport system permease protein